MRCKICDLEVKGNIGLGRHLNMGHNISYLEYNVKYNNFTIPSCICGDRVKHKEGMRFNTTCGCEECIKLTLRLARLKFMEDNPEQTAWRLKNMSYPEKVFKDMAVRLELDKKFKIIREYPVFPYYIDYAFVNEKVAIEIDGSQHKLSSRKNKDDKKDKLLISLGWKVYRVTAKQLINNPDLVIQEIIDFIGDSKTISSCGIIEHKPKKYKSIRINGKNTDKEINAFIAQRKIERPPYEQLINEINELAYVGTGRKYGVSDNAIRKWKKFYNKFDK